MPAQSKFDQVEKINEKIDASCGLFVEIGRASCRERVCLYV